MSSTSAQFTATHLKLNLDMIRNISPGQSLIVNIPRTSCIVLLSSNVIDRYKSQFESTPRPPNIGPSDPLFIDIPLNHEDISVRTNGNPGIEITDSAARERIWDAMGIRPGTEPQPRQAQLPPQMLPQMPHPPQTQQSPQIPQTPETSLQSQQNSQQTNMPRTITLNVNGRSHTAHIPPHVQGQHINIQLNDANTSTNAQSAQEGEDGHRVVEPSDQQTRQQARQRQQQLFQQMQQRRQQARQQAQQRQQQPQQQQDMNLLQQVTNLAHQPVCVPLPTAQVPADTICGVCYELIFEPTTGKCKCVFCKKCLSTWHSASQDASGNASCPKCRCSFALGDLKEAANFWEDNAPDTEVDCPHEGCNIKCTLKNIKAHMKACPRLPYHCKYKEYGCTFVGIKEDLENHVCSCAGLEVLIKKLHTLSVGTGQMKIMLHQHKEWIGLLSNQLKNVQHHLNLNDPKAWWNSVEVRVGEYCSGGVQ